MRVSHLRLLFLMPALLIAFGVFSRCAMAEDAAAGVVADLFENDVLADNVFAIRQAAARLPEVDRYEFLKSHVLPRRLHREFRLLGKLTPTDPPDSAVTEHPIDVARIQSGTQRNQRRIHTGGIFVSPVFDLIEAAKETGKLDELRVAVQAVESQGEVQQRCQLSLLAMIAIAKGDLDEAARSTDELYQRFVKQRFDRLQDRMAETLFLWTAAEQGVLLDEALQFLVSIQDSQIRAGKSHGPTEWDVLMIHLIGRIRHHKLPQEQHTQSWTAAPDLKTWHWVTRTHSWSNGLGLPPGHVQTHKGAVDVLAKMDDEFLLFTSPIRGNYTLECLCTCFGWKEIHPLINGSWITPVWHHESVQVGELYSVAPEIKLQPKLSQVDNRLHYRVDVRDGVCSRYINSRLISRTVLPREHDPWIAIRNPGSGVGSVRDVRIWGEPTVPDEVRLLELRSRARETTDKLADFANEATTLTQRPISDLPGWITWHEDTWTPEKQSWKLEQDSSGVTQIVGQYRPELSGTGAERMLRYVWPLVWNSDVSYEFFYEPGKSIVHPSLGRRAFLIDRGAVQMHDTTNGVWENSGLDPLKQSASGSHVELDSLPLKSGEWNRMVVQTNGDVLRLLLNDVLIHESDIAATNDRSFGLFYYCGQTESRVRNIVLKGDWPKSVPSVVEQELRGTETDVLDKERDALAESFEFDFTKTTTQEVRSVFAESLHEPTATMLLPEGLQMSGVAKPKGTATSLVGPRMTITGDFDVIAEFSDLKIKVSDNGIGAIYLGPRMPGKEFGAHLLYRGMTQHPGSRLREVIQVEVLRVVQNNRSWGFPASFADDCRSGRLRVARRGSTYHFLIAPLDSQNFRLLHSMEVSDDSILPGDFMLRTSCYSQGAENSEVSVVWKKMSVRADSITRATGPGKVALRNLYLLDLTDEGSERNAAKAPISPEDPITLLAAADEQYTQMKWPTWSHDGKFIIYETNNGQYSVLNRITLDDMQRRVLVIGTLPSLSPDGSELVTTSNGPGISIITLSRGNVVTKALDPDGISGAWSPDGRYIAWISNKRIVVHDVKTNHRRTIPADDQPSPFRSIEKGLGWSRDSKSLAFKAKLLTDEGDAVAIVALDIDKPDKVNVLYTGIRLHSDVSWHPDGNQVLFSGLDPSTGTPQMFIVKRDAPQKIVPVPGQPQDWRIIDCDWSPDGSKLVFTAEPK